MSQENDSGMLQDIFILDMLCFRTPWKTLKTRASERDLKSNYNNVNVSGPSNNNSSLDSRLTPWPLPLCSSNETPSTTLAFEENMSKFFSSFSFLEQGIFLHKLGEQNKNKQKFYRTKKLPDRLSRFLWLGSVPNQATSNSAYIKNLFSLLLRCEIGWRVQRVVWGNAKEVAEHTRR